LFSDVCNSLKEEHMPLSRSTSTIIFGAWLAIGAPVSASANIVTDWDEKAIAVVMPARPLGVSQQVYTGARPRELAASGQVRSNGAAPSAGLHSEADARSDQADRLHRATAS
jgi:hypothetical protein